MQRQVWKVKEVREQALEYRGVQNEDETTFQKVTQSARRSIGTVPCEARKGKELGGGTLLRWMDSITIWNVRGINSLLKRKVVKKVLN